MQAAAVAYAVWTSLLVLVLVLVLPYASMERKTVTI